jgi:phosphatidylglycerol---prolipoprotein diacylglyceryl transferase
MYPRISDVFRDLFGFDFPIPIYSFGFMVAVAIMTAAWLLQKEFDRLYSAGRINGVRIQDPAAQKGGKKGKRRSFVQASPSYLVGTITVLAIVAGFAGSKLFHILENLGDFVSSPLRMVFSTGGFTFYGGLVVAGLTIAWYVKRKGLSVPIVADSMAPGLMLGYGIGRIGCQLSGDGDWGITANLAAKPEWLPTWLWAETYTGNILGIDLSQAAVYPTPIYETTAAVLLFLVLFHYRDHLHAAGWLFWLYLTVNGIERFFIEKIRVNNRFDLFGITMTQAEIIAVVLIVVGCVGMWKTRHRE